MISKGDPFLPGARGRVCVSRFGRTYPTTPLRTNPTERLAVAAELPNADPSELCQSPQGTETSGTPVGEPVTLLTDTGSNHRLGVTDRADGPASEAGCTRARLGCVASRRITCRSPSVSALAGTASPIRRSITREGPLQACRSRTPGRCRATEAALRYLRPG